MSYNSLRLTGLPEQILQKDVQELLLAFGPIQNLRISKERIHKYDEKHKFSVESSKQSNECEIFVTYVDAHDATEARDNLNGAVWSENYVIYVNYCDDNFALNEEDLFNSTWSKRNGD